VRPVNGVDRYANDMPIEPVAAIDRSSRIHLAVARDGCGRAGIGGSRCCDDVEEADVGGAWGEDPWRRSAYRWCDERGWTQHVSDGVTESLDQPGERQQQPAAASPSTPTWVEPSSTARVEPEPVIRVAATTTSTAPRRWPLVVLGMVGSFALGGWIFSGDDEPSPTSAATESANTPEVAVVVGEPTPVLLPTTTPNTVPVAAVLPPLVPPTTTNTPIPMTEAEWAARNDGAIDDLEWTLVDAAISLFGLPVPAREELVALGTSGCQLASASATLAEFESGLGQQMATSALPPGQFGLLVGAAGGVMCMDALTKLGLTPAV